MSHDAQQVRPRVEGERELEILRAALDVLAEVGYDRLTMDAVAVAAKASKATLYRRWTKATLVADALRATFRPAEVPDTGSLREDLLATFCGLGGVADPHSLAVFTGVLTALARDPEFAALFRADVIGPKAEIVRTVYRRARARGELRDDVDVDLLAPALPGILLHRYFMFGEPPTPAAAERVIDQIVLPAVLARALPRTGEKP